MCIDRYGKDRDGVHTVCYCADQCLRVFKPKVHGGGYHRDGGRDVRGLLRGRLHRPSPWSRFHGALRPQLSQWVSSPVCVHVCASPSLCMQITPHEEVSKHQGLLPEHTVLQGRRSQSTDQQTELSISGKHNQPSCSTEGTSDLWSLDITFSLQINGEHALEPSFENLMQFLRTFTIALAVCLLQNMGGNAKSIVLIYPCQNNYTSLKYQKWPAEC